MASIKLSGLWIHDAGDLSNFIVVSTQTVDEVPSIDGQVRSYGARRRIVTTELEARTATFGAVHLSRTHLGWLLQRRGRLLLWRAASLTGGLMWGVTFAVPHRPLKYRTDAVSATWTATEATWSAEV